MARGRQLSERNERFAMIPEAAHGLYVAELGDGIVKVGHSRNFRSRMIALNNAENLKGLRLGRYTLYYGRYSSEKVCLEAVAAHADPLPGRNEYFAGIPFDRACALVAETLCEVA